MDGQLQRGLKDAPPGGGESPSQSSPDLEAFRERSLQKGVNPVVYWVIRALFIPFFLVYFRMQRIGREHLPRSGPLLLASNHRSFLDPFVIGSLLRRPVYYMAKRELFEKRWQAWILNALGAFPVDRGAGDGQAMRAARAILQRGDCVVLFPEGTRIRRGPLRSPHRGVGRLALETGAPVAPVAVHGTEHVRRGWRIRPRKVRVRVGPPLLFPTTQNCSPELASGVTTRVWACVNLQWEWLGGAHAPRPPAIGTSAARETGQEVGRGAVREPGNGADREAGHGANREAGHGANREAGHGANREAGRDAAHQVSRAA